MSRDTLWQINTFIARNQLHSNPEVLQTEHFQKMFATERELFLLYFLYPDFTGSVTSNLQGKPHHTFHLTFLFFYWLCIYGGTEPASNLKSIDCSTRNLADVIPRNLYLLEKELAVGVGKGPVRAECWGPRKRQTHMISFLSHSSRLLFNERRKEGGGAGGREKARE